jgi:uncharacterized membrane protein
MKTKTQSIVLASMLAALTCAATMVVKIPSPLHGYIHLGDCLVLVCGWLLGPVYGFWAAGIGSALADLFAGYLVYAPATFVIKGLMALTACVLCRNKTNVSALVFGGVTAEVLMVVGYLAFESLLYGFVPSLANVPANGVQGIAGIIFGVVLMKALEKHNIG